MSEQSRWSWARWRAPLVACAAVALSVGAAACSESLDGGIACPSLCPSQEEQFRDTVLEAVVLDTSISGYPTLGLSSTLLLANRPDTLVTRAVLRYDQLITAYLPNGTGSLDSITTVDSVYLVLPLDTTGSRGSSPVTLELFDVDTTASDSVTAVVRTLFRPDRLIGSLTLTPSAAGDSIRVPISNAVLEQKLADRTRLRIGMQLTGGSGQLRLQAFELGAGAPTLRYDPNTDTTYSPMLLSTNTTIDGATTDLLLAYQVYGITEVGSPPLEPNTLIVGGFPAYRSYLRFNVPLRITDSSTIVRAELLLTQKPSHFANTTDSVGIVPLVPTTAENVTDLSRVLDLAAEGVFAGIDTVAMVPADSGRRVINILSMARSWASLPTNVPRAIAFRIGLEGAQPAELRFFSSKAESSLRPRLRITYLPRAEFVLP